MNLQRYLREEVGLPSETSELLEGLFAVEHFSKGDIILQPGSHSTKTYYVEKGIIRMFYFKDEKNISRHFFAEKSFYAPIECIFLNEHYPYYVEMLEDGIIRTIEFSILEKYLDADIEQRRFFRQLMFRTIKGLTERLHSIQFQSASERYSLMLKNHPTILLRIPLMHIASYLGITQQTLSVIRAERTK